MRFIFLLFVVVPIVEMWVLIEVGGIIGALPTIGLVVLTAMVGIALLKQQGFSTLFRAQSKLREGQLPAKEMAEGILLAIGGALLLTPGFVTDAIGFSCLTPGLRQLIIAWAVKHFGGRIQGGMQMGAQPWMNRKGEAGKPTSEDNGDTVDGEYRREKGD